MNARHRRIRRHIRKNRRATQLVQSGYVPSLGHLLRSSPLGVVPDGRVVLVGDTGTAYRWCAEEAEKGEESVARPLDGSKGKWVRQREEDRA
jgi:hypothetical protein